MYCSSCGKELNDSDKFCPNCGKSSSKEHDQQDVSQEEKLHCPKCLSDQLTTNQKGFSGSKALGGAVLVGGIGLFAGFHGSKNITITCLACNHKFKPSEGKIINNKKEFLEKRCVICGP